MDKLTRRNIRYICFRLQTEATGGVKAEKEVEGIMQFVDEVRDHMEQQADFDGWNNFGKTWDVGEKSFLVAVLRKSSIQSDWNKILKEEAKALPKEKVQGAKEKQPAAPEEIPPQEETPAPAEIKQVENRKQSKKVSFWDKLK